MLNDLILVGIISNKLVLKKVNGRDCLDVIIAVKSEFKDKELNKYTYDKIKFTLWGKLAKKTAYHCRPGIAIAIQGNVITRKSNKELINKIMVERITYLGMKL